MFTKLILAIACVSIVCFVCTVQAQPNPIPVDVPVVVVADPVADPAAAVTVPEEGEEVGFIISSVKWIVEKFKNKEYGPAIAAITMLLLTIANILMLRFGKAVKKLIMPWISVATGLGVALAIKLAGLAAGASVVDWISALGQGLMIGLTAVGLWETLGRWVFKKFLAKAKEKGEAKVNGTA